MFESFVAFLGTQFRGPVTFSRRLRLGTAPNIPKRQTRFKGGLSWKNVQFADRVEFESATMDRNFHCITTTFDSTMSFSDSRVAGFYMHGTQFKAETTFLGCAFTETTRFEKVNFELGANFSGSTFTGETEFGPWNYSRPIYFTGSTFESRTSFHAASNWDRLRMPWSHIPEALSTIMGSVQPDLVFPTPWPGPRLAAP
ncbi:pentapeptide repeat-containing protein [Rhodococcus erythropolis]